jgi:crotonobetainyl-CoA:carnitine CoA-transferase CaiB-like acyl-CoA transferase
MKTLGLPIKLSSTPGGVTRPAPLLGQHTDEILSELGYTRDELAGLRAAKAI